MISMHIDMGLNESLEGNNILVGGKAVYHFMYVG